MTTAITYWIPGWAADSRVFDSLISELEVSPGGRAVPFDIPWSSGPARSAEGNSYCEALLARLAGDKIASGGVNLVGWSLGALVALETAAARPDAVRSLALISACGSFVKRPGNPHGKDRRIIQRMKRRLGADPAGLIADFQREMFGPGREELYESFRQKAGSGYLEMEPAALEQGLDYLLNTDPRDSFQRITCPVLVLHAADDTIIDFRLGEELAAALPGAVFVPLEAGGHIPFRGAEKKFAGLLGEFWGKIKETG